MEKVEPSTYYIRFHHHAFERNSEANAKKISFLMFVLTTFSRDDVGSRFWRISVGGAKKSSTQVKHISIHITPLQHVPPRTLEIGKTTAYAQIRIGFYSLIMYFVHSLNFDRKNCGERCLLVPPWL